jgi:hypothetical protein
LALNQSSDSNISGTLITSINFIPTAGAILAYCEATITNSVAETVTISGTLNGDDIKPLSITFN